MKNFFLILIFLIFLSVGPIYAQTNKRARATVAECVERDIVLQRYASDYNAAYSYRYSSSGGIKGEVCIVRFYEDLSAKSFKEIKVKGITVFNAMNSAGSYRPLGYDSMLSGMEDGRRFVDFINVRETKK